MIKSVATLGINNSFIKLFVENKEDKNELGIIYSTFFVFLLVSTVMGLLIALFADSISEFYFLPIRLLIPFVFWIAATFDCDQCILDGL
jgi:PST family polysaccharide transporter